MGEIVSDFHALAASSAYLQDILSRYQKDPAGVPSDWRAALDLISAYFPHALAASPSALGGLEAFNLVRRHAHLDARLDPLERPLPARWEQLRQEFLRRLPESTSKDRAIAALLDLYAGTLAVETGHIDDLERSEWISVRREQVPAAGIEARREALKNVVRAETFEHFMGVRFTGKKRFGVEGAESLHALIGQLLHRAAAAGVQEVVIGAMHRGRLGLMANVMGQSLEQLFARMKGQFPFEERGRAADVPYHLGLTTQVSTPQGALLVHWLPNPSHLEAINCVALGFARHRQEALGSAAAVLPLIFHTDASVVAQGVVAEGIQLAELPAYGVGGALNVIVNNQVGFTTDPEQGRTSRYCTAQWKAIDSLIAHVNGNDIDAVIAAADLCFDYRREFKGESVIDLVCYRRHGHNEVDEPRFTQPRYYAVADSQPPLSSSYMKALPQEVAIEAEFASGIAAQYRAALESAFSSASASASAKPDPVGIEESAGVGVFAPLEVIAELASRIPAQGEFHPKARRVVTQRRDEVATAVPWASAELLAIGSILSAGWTVRLTGQDVDRGAFSQRHLSLFDMRTNARHTAFDERPPNWGALQVHNSPLSEYATLAFEYGYSLVPRATLTVWEAQFGDFANGAQTVFDQFISSGYEKWGQRSGLVVLLPHGLEGQGPEHSSARIERMLQLAARDNVRIVHPSTPASYFHLLCSQVREASRRPLIVFTPKKLLRLKAALSPRAAFEGAFQPLIVDPAPGRPQRTLICAGKIYYDLMDALAEHAIPHVTVMRLEQLYPFPAAELAQALRSTPGTDLVWVQEESVNYGAWTWVRPHLERALSESGASNTRLSCISRPECPSPAGSFHQDHDADQQRLARAAVGLHEVSLERSIGRG